MSIGRLRCLVKLQKFYETKCKALSIQKCIVSKDLWNDNLKQSSADSHA